MTMPDDINARTDDFDAGVARLPPAENELVVDLDGFEGPLDLLLALARTQKLDLSKMSMLALAEQYIAFIEQAGRMRLELAADYLVMAAWLAYLKSRLLLPKDASKPEELPAEMVATMLAFRLQRLDAMRAASVKLLNRPRFGIDVTGRGMPEGVTVHRQSLYTASVYDLLSTYASQRRRTARGRVTIKLRQVWSIKEARGRLERLLGELANFDGWVGFDTFIARYAMTPAERRTALASSFGAILELAREGAINVRQERAFAPIEVTRVA